MTEKVERAGAALSHRGPDDKGLFVASLSTSGEWRLEDDSDAIASAVLVNRRLSILDRSRNGHQPMSAPDGRCTITYNGELYNYLEVRAQLEAKGHRFCSEGDTEVVLRAYLEWGQDCLSRFIGMFAIAVVDLEREVLFLARDPIGQKPLYYARVDSALAFASELSALLAGFPEISRDVNPDMVWEYLKTGLTDAPGETLLARVQTVQPGSSCEVSLRSGDVSPPVWHWRPPPVGEVLDLSWDEAAANLRELLLRSVELHLRSDTSVGSLLSGGLDSSSIVMAMREVGGDNLDIHTFSYIASDGAFSEEPWIDIVNREAHAIPHKIELVASELDSDLDRFVNALDEPAPSLAIYAQFRLYQAARKSGVPVVLDGQGSDEIFGGYPSMWALHLAGLLANGRIGRAWQFTRSIGSQRAPWDPSVRRVLLGALARVHDSVFREAARHRTHGASYIDSDWVAKECRSAPAMAHGAGRHALQQRARYSVQRGLPPLLRYTDRNSMAHSVESRLPFLTPELLDFALRLPAHYLIGEDGSTKTLLRAALRDLVPAQILERPFRVGFAVPSAAWMRSLPALTEAARTASQVPAVNQAVCEPWLQTLVDPQGELSERTTFVLWRLAALGLWGERFSVAW